MDGDLHLFFLSANLVSFTRPTYDPWYQATENTDIRRDAPGGSTGNITFDDRMRVWIQDEAASPLACKQQEQICNPSRLEGSRCGPLASNMDYILSAWEDGLVFLNETAWKNRLLWAMNGALMNLGGDMTRVVAQLGAHSLLSRTTLSMQGLQGPLPVDQWMSDVEHWFHVTMTSFQGSFLTSAVGPTDPNVALFNNQKPTTPEERWFCENQVGAQSQGGMGCVMLRKRANQ